MRFQAAHHIVGTSFVEFVHKAQLVQAEALKTAVEHWRRRKFKTAGSLFWQSHLTVSSPYSTLLPGFVLMGIGMAFVMSPMSTAAMNSVEPTRVSDWYWLCSHEQVEILRQHFAAKTAAKQKRQMLKEKRQKKASD